MPSNQVYISGALTMFDRKKWYEEIGKMIAGAKKYFLQAFVDRDTVPYEGFSAPSRETMEEYLGIARKYVPEAALRGID